MDHPNPAADPTPGRPRSAESWPTDHAAGRDDATAAHPTPDLAPPHGCSSYGRGHTPHWIQVRLSRETGLATPGRASVGDDGWITVEIRAHSADSVSRELAGFGNKVAVRSPVEVRDALDPRSALATRVVPGGAAPGALATMLERCDARLTAAEHWIEDRRRRSEAAEAALLALARERAAG